MSNGIFDPPLSGAEAARRLAALGDERVIGIVPKSAVDKYSATMLRLWLSEATSPEKALAALEARIRARHQRRVGTYYPDGCLTCWDAYDDRPEPFPCAEILALLPEESHVSR